MSRRNDVRRIDGRAHNELRPVRIVPGYQTYPEGSALIEMGQTRVLCAASLEERVPPFLKGQGTGWVTAEYSMLPRSTLTRHPREGRAGLGEGRSQEIQRLIGRSLRAVVDLSSLGERTVILDCDVLQADGGTRTAAITGAYVALALALRTLESRGVIRGSPLRSAVAAVSTGIVAGHCLLDLCYEEDFRAAVDFNVVMTREGQFVEVQGTAEGRPFTKQTLDNILALGEKGIRELFETQDEALASLRT
ncbi:MAG: ribonuclease PH [Chloroflexi bacterium]|nr:ribonuclease PH [Chloroflexota bacterium]